MNCVQIFHFKCFIAYILHVRLITRSFRVNSHFLLDKKFQFKIVVSICTPSATPHSLMFANTARNIRCVVNGGRLSLVTMLGKRERAVVQHTASKHRRSLSCVSRVVMLYCAAIVVVLLKYYCNTIALNCIDT